MCYFADGPSGAIILHEGPCTPSEQEDVPNPIDETLYPPDDNIAVDPVPPVVPVPGNVPVKKSYKKTKQILP